MASLVLEGALPATIFGVNLPEKVGREQAEGLLLAPVPFFAGLPHVLAFWPHWPEVVGPSPTMTDGADKGGAGKGQYDAMTAPAFWYIARQRPQRDMQRKIWNRVSNACAWSEGSK